MKNLSLLLFSFLILTQVFAQKGILKWGETDRLCFADEYLGAQDDALYILKGSTLNPGKMSEFRVDIQDKNSMSITNSIDFSKTLRKLSGNIFRKAFLVDDKIYVFSLNTYQKKLIGSVLNKDGSIVTEQVVLAQAPITHIGKGPYGIALLKDQKKFVVTKEVLLKGQKDGIVSISLFDLGLTKLSGNEIHFPSIIDEFSINNVVSDSSDVFLLSATMTRNEQRAIGLDKEIFSSSKHVWLTCNLKTNESHQLALPLAFDTDNTPISDAYWYMDRNKTITFVGLTIGGVIVTKYDLTGNAFANKFAPFKGTINTAGYSIKKVQTHGVDTYVFLELDSERAINYEKGPSMLLRDSKDLIVIKVDKENNIVWNTPIYKNQETRRIENSVYDIYTAASFFTIISDKNVLVFYNDDPKNLKISDSSVKKFLCGDFDGSDLVVVSINSENGSYDKKLFTKNTEFAIMPNASEKVNEHEFLVRGCTGYYRKSQYGIIKVD